MGLLDRGTKNMNANLNDKDKAMDTAIRFQKRMRIPKFFFLIFGITIILAFIQDVITGSNFLQTTIMQIIFAIYLGFGGIIILLYIIIAGICPYCHEFQKMNYGTSVGIGSDSFTVRRRQLLPDLAAAFAPPPRRKLYQLLPKFIPV